MNDRRLIKKYANRRLYDTVASKHVTLADIRKLIVAGVNVQIVDDTSDEDITRALLLQIIVDQERSGEPLLTEVLLTQLIRFYGDPMQHMMGDYLQQSVNTFMQQQRDFQERMTSVLSAAPVDAMQGIIKQNLAAWESLVSAGVGRAPFTPPTTKESSDGDRSE